MSLLYRMGTYSWLFPAFSKACTACGICVKVCPRQALHRVEAPEQEKEKEKTAPTWYMAVIPWLCSSCGLCALVCPTGGIDGLTYRKLPDPTRPCGQGITAPRCPRCQEPMMGESGDLCARCRAETTLRPPWDI